MKRGKFPRRFYQSTFPRDPHRCSSTEMHRDKRSLQKTIFCTYIMENITISLSRIHVVRNMSDLEDLSSCHVLEEMPRFCENSLHERFVKFFFSWTCITSSKTIVTARAVKTTQRQTFLKGKGGFESISKKFKKHLRYWWNDQDFRGTAKTKELPEPGPSMVGRERTSRDSRSHTRSFARLILGVWNQIQEKNNSPRSLQGKSRS